MNGEARVRDEANSGFRPILQHVWLAILIFGTWLGFHPYRGIVNDARLYMAQALHTLEPGVFNRDLFFAFGSQDDFTVFSRLFAPLVEHLGPSAAAVSVVVLGHLLWISGASALTIRLSGLTAASFVSLMLVAAMPNYYGGWHVFSYGEGFASPRLLSEGLSLWALAALVRQRFIVATVITFLAGLLHPLVALTILIVGLSFLVLRDWRWVLVGVVGTAAVLLAAYAAVPPFDHLLMRMDADWLSVVVKRNVYLFPTRWRAIDWSWLAFTATTVFASATVLSGWRRNLMFSVLIAGLGGTAATYLGADVWHNLFMIQIQTFRILWLLHVFAYLGAGILVVRLWRLEEDGLALIALIMLSCLVTLVFHPVLGAVTGIGVLVFCIFRLSNRFGPLPAIIRAGSIVLTGSVIVVLSIYHLRAVIEHIAVEHDVRKVSDALGFITIIEILAIAFVATVSLRFVADVPRVVLPVIASVLVLVSAMGWDRQTDWLRLMASGARADPLLPYLATDAQVFWEHDVRGAWLLLRRPSYVSSAQGAGIAFVRETAMLFRDRARVIQLFTNQSLVNPFSTRKRQWSPPPTPTRDALLTACRRDRNLDAIVLSRAVKGAYSAKWKAPVAVRDSPPMLAEAVPRPSATWFYLYICERLR